MADKKNSAALLAAVRRYDEKTYERIQLRVKNGEKELIQQAADKEGKSLNGYIVEAINEKMVKGSK